MLCPECGRFLTRYGVATGSPLRLNRCHTCAGVWLDKGEYEELEQLGLAHRMHFIFSEPWQAELSRQRQHRAYEDLLLEKLGQADFAEIRRIKQWLASHRFRGEMLAFLQR